MHLFYEEKNQLLGLVLTKICSNQDFEVNLLEPFSDNILDEFGSETSLITVLRKW